jgi:hypothetical protein
MIKHLLALAVLLASTLAHAEPLEDWTDTDKMLLASSTVMIMADWAQTRYIVRHPEYHERNRIMGPHPTMGIVNSYFIGALAANYLIAEYFPGTRTELLIAVTVVEGITVRQNRMLGLRFAF